MMPRGEKMSWYAFIGYTLAALVVGVVIAVLVGCSDLAYSVHRTALGIDCRPEKLQHGQCVSTAKQESK